MALLLIWIPLESSITSPRKIWAIISLNLSFTLAIIMKNPSSINQLKFQSQINYPLSLCLRAEDSAVGTGKTKTELPNRKEETEFI